MVTPSDSTYRHRSRVDARGSDSFEKSSFKSKMKSSSPGNNGRFSWNPVVNESDRNGLLSSSSNTISMSLLSGRNKGGTKIATNINTTANDEANSAAPIVSPRKIDQWNANRDIPAGAVRNNPFVPQPKPQPPQLQHQKKQWDTSDIPRGSVAARVLESRSPRSNDGTNSLISPSKLGPISPTNLTGRINRRPSPKSNSFNFSPRTGDRQNSLMGDIHNNTRPVGSNIQRGFPSSGDDSPWHTKSLTVSSPSKNARQQTPQRSYGNTEKRVVKVINNKLDRNVTNGTVNARLSTLSKEISPFEGVSKFESVKAKTGVYRKTVGGVTVKDVMSTKIKNDNNNDDDPWIIPDRDTSNTQVFADEWGEAVVAATSTESDDWEAPVKDWVRSGESLPSTNQNRNFQHSSFSDQHYNKTANSFVQSPKVRHAIDPKNAAPVLASSPKDAKSYRQPQERVSQNRMNGGVEAVDTKAWSASPKVLNNALNHSVSKAEMISNTHFENSFGGENANHKIDSQIFSSNVSTSARSREQQILNETHKNEQRDHNDGAKYFDIPMSGHRSKIDDSNSIASHLSTPVSLQNENSAGYDCDGENKFSGEKKKKKGFFKGIFGKRRNSRDKDDRRKSKERDINSKNKEITQKTKKSQNRNGRSDESERKSNDFKIASPIEAIKLSLSPRGRYQEKLSIDTTVDRSSQGITFCEELNKNHTSKEKGNGDFPDDSLSSPISSIVISGCENFGKESSNPSTSTNLIVKKTEDDEYVDPALDHLDMEIDSEDDENITKPISIMLIPPPPPPPPPRMQRKGTGKSISRGSQKNIGLSLDKASKNAQKMVREKNNVERKFSGTCSSSLEEKPKSLSHLQLNYLDRDADSKPDKNKKMRSKQILNQGLAEEKSHDTSHDIATKIPQEDACHHSVKMAHSQSSSTNVDVNKKAYQGRPTMADTVSSDHNTFRGASPSRNAAKLAGQARLRRNIPIESSANLPGRIQVRENITGCRNTKEESVAILPVRLASANTPKLPGRMKLRNNSSTRNDGSKELDTINSRRSKFSRPASRNSSPARNNVEPAKNQISKVRTFPRKNDISEGTDESSIANRYRKKTIFNNVQNASVIHHTGQSRRLASTKVQNLISPDPRRNNIFSQTSKDSSINERGNQIKKFSKANHAFRSITGKKYRSEDVEDSRRYPSIPAASTSASDLSCSSSTYENYQRKLSDSLEKANIRTQSSNEMSVHSHRSLDDSSIESDIRILRSILRRPRLDKDNENVITVSRKIEEFPKYSEESATDPMQRVGLRLLSAAIIPIQTEVRRFLAMRRALTRMWALIVVQTYTRRFLAQKRYGESLDSIIVIQATFRGHKARNCIIDKHIFAIEIQRFVRGYLATMLVYEEIYKVTLVQSFVRRKIAMDYAAYRMSLVIQLQAVARGFLAHVHYSRLRRSATVIQSNWRCFYNRLTYQFDLLDIIIVQSLWRKKLGIRAALRKFEERHNVAATIIQAEWRAYDCRMDFICFLAARKIQNKWRSFICRKNYTEYNVVTRIQSVVRMYFCRLDYIDYQAATLVQSVTRMYFCRLDYIDYQAATTIQSLARMYLCRSDYVEYQAASIIQSGARMIQCRSKYVEYKASTIIQSVVQMYLCRLDYVDYQAAKAIQSLGRMYLCRSDYVDYRAATMIQAVARMYSCRAIYVEYQGATLIQSVARMFVCRSDYVDYQAATAIEKVARMYLCRLDYVDYQAATAIQKVARMYMCRLDYVDYQAATTMQSLARMYLCRSDYVDYQAATIIQTLPRMYLCRSKYIKHKAAVIIQAAWRCHDCRMDYDFYTAARTIQTKWRSSTCRNDYVTFVAARKIQTNWRSSFFRKHYVTFISARKIQTRWRSFICREDFNAFIAARKIQTTWRSSICRKDYVAFMAARMIQRKWRSSVCRNDYVTFMAARKIQTTWRAYACRKEYIENFATTMIQAQWRSYDCSSMYHRYCAARAIQRTWRSYDCKMNYLHFLADILIVQSTIRRFLVQKQVEATKNSAATTIQRIYRGYTSLTFYTETVAATVIQRTWRSFVCYADYEEFKAARKIQSVWRGYTCFAFFKEYIASRKIQSAWRSHACLAFYKEYIASRKIQSACRRFVDWNYYTRYCASRKIQSEWRKGTDRSHYTKYIAARKIQSVWRRHVDYTSFTTYIATRNIQRMWRRHVHYTYFTTYIAARKIQSAWRGFVDYADHQEFLTVRKIQTAWRSYFHSNAFKRYKAVVKIQAILRGKFYFNVYKRYVAARIIQSAWRGLICFIDYHEYLTVRRIQTVWRGYYHSNSYKQYIAARKIQSTWRGSLCCADFRDYISARKIQSAWRAFLCRRDFKREKSAIVIQSAWRGFLIYADYMFEVADIVVVQKQIRGWLARREANRRQRVKKHIAATTIQKHWRRFVDETEFVLMKYEHHAAATIQTYWRRFWCFSNFIIALDCSIQIQAQMRGYLQRKEFISNKFASVSIQSSWRKASAKQLKSRLSVIHAITKTSYAKGKTQSEAAIQIQRIFRGSLSRAALKVYLSAVKIQSRIRGAQARVAIKLYLMVRKIQTVYRGYIPRRRYMEYIAARKIQTNWRCYNSRRKYCIYVAARKIQTTWRGYTPRRSYTTFVAARCIQNKWRYVKANQEVLVMRGEFLAASLIQTAWRGFVCYADFVFTLSDIVASQRIARGYLTRKKYSFIIKSNIIRKKKELNSAVLIQRICRGFHARQNYWYTLGCTMQIQSWWRGRVVYNIIQKQSNALMVLQCFARRCLARQEYIQRRFVFLLIHTAEAERAKKIKSIKNQEIVRDEMENRERERAARVIQRFFLYVKEEVDQIVLATTRRKKWRKQMKTDERVGDVDEALLEDVWMGLAPRFEKDPFTSHYTNFGSGSVGGDRYHDDNANELAGFIMKYGPHPTTTIQMIRNVGADDIDDDFQLEEAFIDAEIIQAKERKILARGMSNLHRRK